MKLEPHGVGRERPARQPRPFDRALAFLDPLLARAALVVVRDHATAIATTSDTTTGVGAGIYPNLVAA